ncbi:protein FAR1-RELATED SEQUENCE 5-like [Rosa chinensis]|uniref:protein FAR1-RELATED SEQUENCE 5-like n=1 Tax=Rosa chinensis TaxID=74649 RepID=UPI000D08EFEA|nr:protein FAR1-RELATED SEQUENCE 5-like [Rosa chinensis]
MEKGDAGAILQYFQKMKEDNSSFDEDDMITNNFWADERSISDYGLFGDVVCFDTTYQTNEYGRPFASFVGVNLQHKQTVVFGAALLYDETIESFKWLFETFLGAMSGKQPKTIHTDQSVAMAGAIVEVFPVTYHTLCVWHIYQNAAKRLSHVFQGSEQFAHDFGKRVYDYEDEDDWLLAWSNMLEKHNLKEDKWLKNLFDMRKKWALPSYDMLCFFEHYERVLADRRYAELIADFKMMQTSPVLSANIKMLQHAEEVYTPEAFRLFQHQYTSIGDYVANKVSKSEMNYEYKVSYRGVAREHLDSIPISDNCEQQEVNEYEVPMLDFSTQDIFVGSTDTTSTALEWEMSKLLRNPGVMKKLLNEVRGIVGNKKYVTDTKSSKAKA